MKSNNITYFLIGKPTNLAQSVLGQYLHIDALVACMRLIVTE